MPAPCCTGDSWVCCGCNWKSKITDAKCQQCVDYWRCSCGCVTNRILREKCEECQGPRPFSIPSSSPRGQASGSRPMDPSPVKLVRPPMSGNAPPAPLLGDCEAATEIASQLGALFTGQQKPPESALHAWISIPSPRGPVKSSEIRLVRVGHGQGLAFFPWGNHRQIRHPEWGEECSSMFRHRGSAGDHSFSLEPGGIFIMCPMKYPWPVCVWCGKFLFPCDAHRGSKIMARTPRRPCVRAAYRATLTPWASATRQGSLRSTCLESTSLTLNDEVSLSSVQLAFHRCTSARACVCNGCGTGLLILHIRLL